MQHGLKLIKKINVATPHQKVNEVLMLAKSRAWVNIDFLELQTPLAVRQLPP
jgi:hypothetical protein